MGTGDYFCRGTLSGDTRSLRSGQAYTTTAKYVWEGNSYYDPLLFALEGGAWKHPMYDALGSTRQLLDNNNQTVTDTYEYEAFGNLMDSSGSTPNPYQYVGSLGYYQTGSSLQHLGARYYMPEVGRFIQRDPATGGTCDFYSYCGNMPTVAVDPSGMIFGITEEDCEQMYGEDCLGKYAAGSFEECMCILERAKDEISEFVKDQCYSLCERKYTGGWKLRACRGACDLVVGAAIDVGGGAVTYIGGGLLCAEIAAGSYVGCWIGYKLCKRLAG